jgi:hypothetical protein
MTDKKKVNPLKVITPKFRLSFPELFQPKAMEREDGTMGDAKYSIQMLFDKKTDLKSLKNVVAKAAKEKWGDNIPKGIYTPFKDGNEKDLEGYEDKIVVNASSKFKPQLVDQKLEEILAQNDLYAGCFARAAIVAYAWEAKNKQGKILKRGVSFNLESVQKLAEGEPFVKRPDATEDFDIVDDGSDNDDNYENDDMDFMN